MFNSNLKPLPFHKPHMISLLHPSYINSGKTYSNSDMLWVHWARSASIPLLEMSFWRWVACTLEQRQQLLVDSIEVLRGWISQGFHSCYPGRFCAYSYRRITYITLHFHKCSKTSECSQCIFGFLLQQRQRSAFVPMNVPLCAFMLMANGTPQVLAAQWCSLHCFQCEEV